MKDVGYPTAKWGFSWAEIAETSPQGVAKMEDNRVSLEIPFGAILDCPMIRASVNGETKEPVTKANFLYGRTQTGKYLVLKDAEAGSYSLSMPGSSRQTVMGGQLMHCSSEFDPVQPVERIEAEINGLLEWSANSSFEIVRDDRFALKAITLKEERAFYEERMLDTDEISIGIAHGHTFDGTALTGGNLVHKCFLDVQFKDPVQADEALDTVLRFSQFVSFCIGDFASINAIRIGFQGCDSLVDAHIPLLDGRPLKERVLGNIPFTLPAINDSIHEALTGWFYKTSPKAKKAESLLVSLLGKTWDLPFDSQIIAASQALELLCKDGPEEDLLALPKEEHRVRMDYLKEYIPDKAIRDWVVVKANGNSKGQKRLISEHIEAHSEMAQRLIPDKKAFIEFEMQQRNASVHEGGGSITTENAENNYFHLQTKILYCYATIWEQLGITPEIIEKRLLNSHFGYTINRIRGV